MDMLCDAPFPLQADGGTVEGSMAFAGDVVSADVPSAGAGAALASEAAVAATAPSDREPVDVSFPLRFDRKAACVQGYGIAVHLARQLVIVAGYSDKRLHCYNLSDGVEVGVAGRGHGAGDMQFNWNCGGVCVTPRGTLLVADYHNHRVPEVDLGVFDRFIRAFGQGDAVGEIEHPDFVDCDGVHVAVSEEGTGRISVLSYITGSLVARAGCGGTAPLSNPVDIKLLADGRGVVVSDYGNHRVVWFSLAGMVLGMAPLAVQSPTDLKYPYGIVQCAAPDGDVVVMVACYGAACNWTRLMKVNLRSGVVDSVDIPGSEDGQFSCVYGIATLPGGGFVALDCAASRFQVFAPTPSR